MAADVTLPDGYTLDPPQPSTTLPPGYTVDPAHPVAGPSGNWLLDQARNIGTAAVNAGVGLVSPIVGDTTWAHHGPPQVVPGAPATDVQTARDNAFNGLGLTEYQPQTAMGRLGQAGLTAAASALMTGKPSSALPAAGGGVTSEAGGEIVDKALPDNPRASMLARALMFIPGAAATKGVANLPFTPISSNLSPQDAALASIARNNGIDLAPGQLSKSPFVRYLYSQLKNLPFSGMGSEAEGQQSAFNRAVSQTFGEDAEKITPDVLNSAKTRIGGVMNNIEGNNAVNLDNNAINRLAQIESDAHSSLTDQEFGVVKKQLDGVMRNLQAGGSISGTTYGNLIGKGSPLDVAANSPNSSIANFAGQIKETLRDSLQGSLSKDDLAAYQNARGQYKALKTVEPLTLRADSSGGVSPATGDISPASLRGAVNRSYSNAATAQAGDIPLNDLAKVGQRFLKEPPDSGTASREAVGHGLGMLGSVGTAIAAALAGEHIGMSLPEAIAAGGSAMAAGRGLGYFLRGNTLPGSIATGRMINGATNPGGFNFTGPGALPPAILGRVLSNPNLQPVPTLSGPATSAN